MIGHLAIGSLVIAITVFIQAEMFSLLSARFESLVRLTRRYLRRFANTGVITVAVLFVLLVQTINVWIWAVVFLLVGAFRELEPSLYFTLIAYTTVGFGDITLGPDWRLLSGLHGRTGAQDGVASATGAQVRSG